jgi:heme b synthase
MQRNFLHEMGREMIANKHELPRLIAWEVTKKCFLNCKHCRACAEYEDYEGEFTSEECFKLIQNIAQFAKPIIILTGGEPLLREDIYEIIRYGRDLGMRMVLASCGVNLDQNTASMLKEAGIMRLSLSLDGWDRKSHDNFRQVQGAFDSVLKAAEALREVGLEFQINTTVTKQNYRQIDDIFNLAVRLGAVGYHPFLLVPTGRGRELADEELDPDEYEKLLNWIYEKSQNVSIQLKPTCAPHYYRIYRQREREAGRVVSTGTHGLNAMTKGCMGGQSFVFISNIGKVQACGFLDVEAGDVREENYDFQRIWESSPLFGELRDINGYYGRCGVCEYRAFCGGCRARAYATTGRYLDEEPYCVYQPVREVKR